MGWRFWCAQITGHLVLLDRKDNNFVQKPIAPGVKLQQFGDTAILLFR
jgi:hypothetical protein